MHTFCAADRPPPTVYADNVPAVAATHIDRFGPFALDRHQRRLSADGRPITTKEWPKKSWKPVLRKKIGVRYRKFYATRHTFISWALSNGMNVKAIAEYVGTSLEMIERSYGKYIGSNGLDPLLRALNATAMPMARDTPETSKPLPLSSMSIENS